MVVVGSGIMAENLTSNEFNILLANTNQEIYLRKMKLFIAMSLPITLTFELDPKCEPKKRRASTHPERGQSSKKFNERKVKL